MRADIFLSRVGLCKRTLLKKTNTLLYIDGKAKKASATVREGSIIELTSNLLHFKIRVLQIPESKNVNKKERSRYYEEIVLEKLLPKKDDFIRWIFED